MATTTNIFERIFDKVDTALATYVTDTATNVISFTGPIFTSLLIVWIAIWGYMVMFGMTNEPLKEGAFRILRITFIITLGLTVTNYTGIVVDFLGKGPEAISAVVTGLPAGTSADTLDNLFYKVFLIVDSAWKKAGIMNGNFGMYIIAVVVLLVGGLLTLIIAFLILLSKVVTAVLLAVGPLFIVLLLFSATQRYFESWIGMVMNFGFILILATAIGQIMASLADSYITVMAATPGALANLADASMLCIVFGLCGLTMSQVPSIAAALGGGVALATKGALGGALSAMRPTSIRRQVKRARRDLQHSGDAITLPYRSGKAGYAAYQKRFGTGNSISGT